MTIVTVVNFLTMGILERKREIGTLRALGFLPKEIARLFFDEAALLTFFGIAAGFATSLVIAALVNRMGIRFQPPGIAGDMQFLLVPNWELCTGAAALMGAVALGSAWLTLRTKVKNNIVDLLAA